MRLYNLCTSCILCRFKRWYSSQTFWNPRNIIKGNCKRIQLSDWSFTLQNQYTSAGCLAKPLYIFWLPCKTYASALSALQNLCIHMCCYLAKSLHILSAALRNLYQSVCSMPCKTDWNLENNYWCLWFILMVSPISLSWFWWRFRVASFRHHNLNG